MHRLICFISDTRNFSVYQANLNGQWITFLDTPDFDDDALSDADILQDLSFTLAGFHKGNRPLNGIVPVRHIKTTHGCTLSEGIP
jgi:hypothetical protein